MIIDNALKNQRIGDKLMPMIVGCLSICLLALSPFHLYSQCNVGAGTLSTTNNTIVCIDGEPDIIDVASSGAFGDNLGWIIANEDNVILDCPSGPPFEFDGSGEGVANIYRIAFQDNITGKVPGQPLSNIGGCFDLSDPIVVIRDRADGGAINSTMGLNVEACSGDIELDLIVINEAFSLNYRFVLTDENNNIISTILDSSINLSNAPPGECRIWGWSFGIEPLPTPGDPISVLTDGTCESISSNFIRVTKIDCSECPANGGFIAPLSDVTFCINGALDFFKAEVTGAGDSLNTWIVTDTDTVIVAIRNAVPINLEGIIDEDLIVWHMESESDLTGLDVGNSFSDLGGCFDLSNGLYIIRQFVDGGLISSDQGDSIPGCVDNMVVEVSHTTSATALEYLYLIADALDTIVKVTSMDSILIDSLQAGEYHVYGWSFKSDTLPMIGDHLSALYKKDCQELSDNFISLFVQDCGDTCAVGAPDIFTLDNTTICIDANSDFVLADGIGGAGSLSSWLITSDDNQILGIFDNPVFSLNLLGVRNSRLWNIRYEDDLDGLSTSNFLSDLEGCFDLSNFIAITGVEANGGVVTTDRGNVVNGCIGNISITMVVEEAPEELDYTYLVADVTDTLLAFTDDPVILLDSFSQDCRIYGWSHLNLPDPVIGMRVFDLIGDDCTSLSENVVVVDKNDCGGNCFIDAGFISTSQSTILCEVDNLDVSRSGQSDDEISTWVITDLNGQIISIQDSSILNMDSLGECRVWSVSFIDELFGLDTANTFDDFIGCFEISNFINISRDVPDGGTITALQGDSIIDCPGFSVVDLSTSSISSFDFAYVLTDTFNQILDISTTNQLIVRPANVYRIWGWSVSHPFTPSDTSFIEDLDQGDCQDISSNFISLTLRDDGSCVTSSDDISIIYLFDIFPNPSYDHFTIQHPTNVSESGSIEIFDMVGRKVHLQRFSRADDKSDLHLGHLATGTYLLHIRSGNRIGTDLLVVL